LENGIKSLAADVGGDGVLAALVVGFIAMFVAINASDRLKELKNKMEAQMETIKGLHNQIEKLGKRKVEDLQEEVDDLTHRIEEVELEDLTARIEELERAENDRERKVDDLREQIEELKSNEDDDEDC